MMVVGQLLVAFARAQPYDVWTPLSSDRSRQTSQIQYGPFDGAYSDEDLKDAIHTEREP